MHMGIWAAQATRYANVNILEQVYPIGHQMGKLPSKGTFADVATPRRMHVRNSIKGAPRSLLSNTNAIGGKEKGDQTKGRVDEYSGDQRAGNLGQDSFCPALTAVRGRA